jgi:hypothetical protein
MFIAQLSTNIWIDGAKLSSFIYGCHKLVCLDIFSKIEYRIATKQRSLKKSNFYLKEYLILYKNFIEILDREFEFELAKFNSNSAQYLSCIFFFQANKLLYV